MVESQFSTTVNSDESCEETPTIHLPGGSFMSPGDQNPSTCVQCELAAHYFPDDRCRACGYPVTLYAPNVQIAKSPRFAEGFASRWEQVKVECVLANGEGAFAVLGQLGSETRCSVSMPVELARSIERDERRYYAPYAVQLRAGTRAPARLEDDQRRVIVDTLMYGSSAGSEIVFGVLTALREAGLPNYGTASVILRDEAIEHRATVLESNSFALVKGIDLESLGSDTPVTGYLTHWTERGKSVQIKIGRNCPLPATKSELQAAILKLGASRSEDEYFEVHIYGEFNGAAIECVHAFSESDSIEAGILKEAAQEARKSQRKHEVK